MTPLEILRSALKAPLPLSEASSFSESLRQLLNDGLVEVKKDNVVPTHAGILAAQTGMISWTPKRSKKS